MEVVAWETDSRRREAAEISIAKCTATGKLRKARGTVGLSSTAELNRETRCEKTCEQ